MNLIDFQKLDLRFGDFIWIMNERGEGFAGNYMSNRYEGSATFQFNNHSNGKTETIEIAKLQRLVINQRAQQ